FSIIRGEVVSLVGPSGCGKSTLLRAIVGTHPPRKGKVVIFSDLLDLPEMEVTQPGRDRGIVYQRYSLFPFLTAQQNVALGLMLDQTSIPFRLFHPLKWRKLRKEHLEKAADLLEKLGLANSIKLYPHELSGGMCQRVAIAQALIMEPEILLLDEPFGALDEATREDLQRMLLTLYLENCKALRQKKKPPYTILLVTHELNEAIFVADRVLGLSQYWNWRDKDFPIPPGATIVYDKVAPVFPPDAEKRYERFLEQREEIRKVVFNPESSLEREQFLLFWNEVRSGRGDGILKNYGENLEG
ncbi:ATP-binding cassette domain-containing protein, partial [Candidatus Sumerlaeota bacterium]|nr:ATP-binding cassette domain-containing protein [Candidatus Sumerlaeota bacterium]